MDGHWGASLGSHALWRKDGLQRLWGRGVLGDREADPKSPASRHRIPGSAALPEAPWSLACPAPELSERVSCGPSTSESNLPGTGPSPYLLQEKW